MPAAVPLARDGGRFWVGEVSYNGIRFPPAIHSQARYVPEMDDSKRMMKYLRMNIRIEAYIYPGVLEATNTSDFSGLAALRYHSSNSVEAIDNTTDLTMEAIRQRLSEPCQRFSFTYQGGGNVVLNAGEGAFDVDNGPKPKLVEWKPLTNKMAKITWECEVAFSPCAVASGSQGLPSYVAQFPFTVTNEISEEGTTIRIIAGSYEVALTRIPNPTTTNPTRGEAHAGKSRPFDMKDAELFINERFPLLKQFKRKQTFTLSNDRKTIDFVLTDSEIPSDEAYGVGCIREDVKLSTSGELAKSGLRRWATTLSGSIEMIAGYPKSYGVAEIARLFDKFYTKSVKKGKQGPKLGPTSASEAEHGSEIKDSYGILRSIRFGDEIFGRTIDFAISWDVFTSLETLFDATGMFKPVRTTHANQNQAWTEWAISASEVIDSGFQDLTINENDDIIVSLCTPLMQGAASGGRVPTTVPDKKVKDKKVKGDDTSDKDKKNPPDGYSDYKAHFHIEADNHTLRHRPLQYIPPYKESVDRNLQQNGDLSFPKPSNPGESDDQGNPLPKVSDVFHKIRETSYTLVFTGMAVRLNYPVPVPNIDKYGNQPLTRVGTDLIRPVKLGNGIDIETGKSYAIHGLVWQKRYAFPAPPANSVINTDGHVAAYV